MNGHDHDLTITGRKQSDIVRAARHLLDLARSGKLCAMGYAVVHFDDEGSVVAGSNAVWVDNRDIREALRGTIGTLSDRFKDKAKPLILTVQ